MTSPLPPADQRTALQVVTSAALADLAQEWATLDLSDALAAKQALLDLLPALADQYGAAASQLATDVYGVLREAAGITSDWEPQIADPTDSIGKLARWSADPLFDREAPDQALALVRAEESLQLSVADQYRQTVMGTSIEDAAADGWQRVVRPEASEGGPCPFCILLASRGFVYKESTVDFAAHGLCHCIAVPAFKGEERPVKAFEPRVPRNEAEAEKWRKERARVYRYMRSHGLLGGETRRPKTSRRS